MLAACLPVGVGHSAFFFLEGHLHKSAVLKPNSKLLWVAKNPSSLFDLLPCLLNSRAFALTVACSRLHATKSKSVGRVRIFVPVSRGEADSHGNWRLRAATSHLNEVPAEGTRREVPDISAACSFGHTPGRATVCFVLTVRGWFVSSAWLSGGADPAAQIANPASQVPARTPTQFVYRVACCVRSSRASSH